MNRFVPGLIAIGLVLAAPALAQLFVGQPIAVNQAPLTFPVITQGPVPTIASGACGASTNGAVVALSRANSGSITIGAQATTVCTVVFAAATLYN